MGGRLSKRKNARRGEDNNVGALAGDLPAPAAPAAPAPKKQRLLRSNDTFSRADMTTFDDLPRDIQRRIFSEALFDDYDACVGGPDGSWPKSLSVPSLPRPVEPVTWEDDQVLFDPVSPGVTEGLCAVKAAIVISTVSKSFMSLARDDSMWQAVLYGLEGSCEFEIEDEENPVREPLTFDLGPKRELLAAELSKKYSLPRLTNEGWLTLSPFDRCRKMLTFIEMVYEDFWNKCSDEDTCVEYAKHLTFYADHILDDDDSNYSVLSGEMLRRTDKEVMYKHFSQDDQPFEDFEVFLGFPPPVVARMLWNSYSEGMTQGESGLREFWEILSGGPMEINSDSSARDRVYFNVLIELMIQGYLENDPVSMRKRGMTEAEIKKRCGD